jgi:hypothetical protein
MAARYWVGGTATWDGTAGTKWALTSGGAGGQAVPTSSDDVYFDSGSGTCTVTVSGTRVCKTLTVSSTSITIQGTSTPQVSVYGNFSLVSGMTWTTGTIIVRVYATGTFTTNGATIYRLTMATVSITVTLGSHLTATNIYHQNGTFNLGGYNVTCSGFTNNSSTSTRVLTMGTGTLKCTLSFTESSATGLTVNCNTSKLQLSGSSSSFNSRGKTFYTVEIDSTSTFNIAAALTCTNLNIVSAGTTAPKVYLSANVTVTGTFTVTGQSSSDPCWVYSLTTAYTISAATVSLTDACFGAITASGTASPFTGTRISLNKTCTNITASTPKTVYWVGNTGTLTDPANHWATSSNGTPGVNNFPLLQDTGVFDAASFSTTSTVTNSVVNYCGQLDFSAIDCSVTFDCTNSLRLRGFIGNSTYLTVTVTSGKNINFYGVDNGTLTSAGTGFNSAPLYIEKYGATLTLGGDLGSVSTPIGDFAITSGTFATANYDIYGELSFSSSNSNTRTLSLGTSTIRTGGQVGFATQTNMTWQGSNASFYLGCNSAGAKSSDFGYLTIYDLDIAIFDGGALTIDQPGNAHDISFYSEIDALHVLGSGSGNAIEFNSLTIEAHLATATNMAVQLNCYGSSVTSTISISSTGSAQAMVQFLSGTHWDCAAFSLDTAGITGDGTYTLHDNSGGGTNTASNEAYIDFCTATGTGVSWLAPGCTDGGNNSGWDFATHLVVANAAHTHTVPNLTITEQITGVTLTVQDAVHTHTVPNLTLTENKTLVVVNATHTHTVPNLTLTENKTLVVANAAHTHTVPNLTLTENKTLVVANAAHTHTVPNLTLTENKTLVVANAAHTHTVPNLTIIEQAATIVLTVANAIHTHTVPNLTLTENKTLVVANAAHTHTVPNLTLTENKTLVVVNAAHTHTVPNLTLTENKTLVVANAAHTHTVPNLTLTENKTLVVVNAAHTHTVPNLTLTENKTLVVANAAHTHTVPNLTITESIGKVLTVQDAVHVHTVQNVTLTQEHQLAVDYATHLHTVANLAILQSHILTVNDSGHATSIESPLLTQLHNLAIANASHALFGEAASVSPHLAVISAVHAVTSDNVALTQAHTLRVDDCFHGPYDFILLDSGEIAIHIGDSYYIKI